MYDLYTTLVNEEQTTVSLTQTIDCIKKGADNGIKKIIYAPLYDGTSKNNSWIKTLQQTMEEGKIDTDILHEQTLPFHVQAADWLHTGQAKVISASNYVLVKPIEQDIGGYASNVLYELSLKGFIPIISKPERHPEFLNNPKLLYMLVKRGAFTYASASSLLGKHGSFVKKRTEQWIEQNLIHFIATDSAIGRMKEYELTEAYERIAKSAYSHKVVEFKQNIKSVMLNNHLTFDQPWKPQRVKRYSYFQQSVIR